MKVNQLKIIEVLIMLFQLNYIVVTIVFNDFFALKYLRDVIILFLFLVCLSKKGINKTEACLFLVFLCLAVVATLKAYNLRLGILCLRRYLIPVMLIYCLKNLYVFKKTESTIRLIKFLLISTAILSVWGIFQAWVLGDSFLLKLGYLTKQTSDGEITLTDSFYFGGLGIQRVVSTLSNSNICALIFGIIIILLICCYDFINLKPKGLFLLFIVCGYILTFSRANILAMVMVTIFFLYKFLPNKRLIFVALVITILAFFISILFVGENNFLYKIWDWILKSLSFSDSSSAGRGAIWLTALKAVIDNPFGFGFGYVGSIARDADVVDYFYCENSYLAIALDFGVIGLIFYIVLLCWILRRLSFLCKNLRQKDKVAFRICYSVKVIIIYFIIASFFSNHIYDMEAVSLITIFIGIALNLASNREQEKNQNLTVLNLSLNPQKS